MSGIVKRTVFYDQLPNQGPLVLHDWNIVLTSVGNMMEPARPWQRLSLTLTGQAATFDPTDDICRVDELQQFPMGKEEMLMGDTIALIGGGTYPRKGY
jgi:hypothetical protein